MTGVSESQLRELAASEDLQERLGATISGGHIDGLPGELLACQLVGGTTVEQDIGQDKHGELDILVVADSSINTAAVATRLGDLWSTTVRANGNEATRAGLIASAQGTDPDQGPALNADVDLLVVDAFDKMNGDHRTAFTEILDSRSYTITTANVQETFSASGANLFLGTPKYGSFDDLDIISKQIDYESEIINAVDVVLPIMESSDGEAEPLDPAIARAVIEQARAIDPTWSDSATDELTGVMDVVGDLNEDDDVSLGIHPARIREAVRKLSEATAKLRFSEMVSDADVDHAWDSYKRAYQAMGLLVELDEDEEEVGEFDADVVSTGTSKSQRDRIQNLKGIINDIESEYDEGAPVDVVLERAAEVGVDKPKAEHEIEQLKQKGEVYEPRTDHLRTS